MTEVKLKPADGVADLHAVVWERLNQPKHRLKAKTRRCSSKVLKLMLGTQILEDHVNLGEAGLNDKDVILAVVRPAPMEISQSSNTADLSRQLAEWIQRFPNEILLGQLGCQRLLTQAMEEGDDLNWACSGTASSNYTRFVQVQTGNMLPAPLSTPPKWAGVNPKKLFLAGFKAKSAPPRIQCAWRDIAACVLKGTSPPPGTSILSACLQRDGGRNIFAEFVALARSPAGLVAIMCSASVSDWRACVTVRGGLTGRYLRHVAESAVTWEQTASFDRAFAQFAETLFGKPLHSQGEWEEEWDDSDCDFGDLYSCEEGAH